MRTAVFHGKHQVSLQEIALPAIADDEVLVEIVAAGICGSDLHRYAGVNPWGNNVEYPYRAGHEFAGLVARVGASVKHITPGEAVVIEPMQLAGCGTCGDCRAGFYNRCQQRAAIPDRRISHGFSEFDAAKSSHVHSIPGNMPMDVAALSDVYACAIHALNRAQAPQGQPIMIIGTGSVALALGHCARSNGLQTLMVGRRQQILDLARKIEAADFTLETINVSPYTVEQLFGARKISTVFEVVGGSDSSTIDMALDVITPGGTIAVLGAFANRLEISYSKANRKEVSLCWCNGYAMHQGKSEFKTALHWLSKNVWLAGRLITHRVDFDDIARAFELALNKSSSQAIKVMLMPKRAHSGAE